MLLALLQLPVGARPLSIPIDAALFAAKNSPMQSTRTNLLLAPSCGILNRRACAVVQCRYESVKQVDEHLGLARRKDGKRPLLGPPGRLGQRVQDREALRCEHQYLPSPIFGIGFSYYIASFLELHDDQPRGRSIDSDESRNADLVQIRSGPQNDHHAILGSRDSKLGRFVKEEGNGNLMGAAD